MSDTAENARLLHRREKDRLRKQRERMRKKCAEMVAAGMDPDESMMKLCEKRNQKMLKKSQPPPPAKSFLGKLEKVRKHPVRPKNIEEKSEYLQKVVEIYSKDPSTRCGKYLTKLFAAQKLAKVVGKDMPEIPLPSLPESPPRSSSPSPSSSSASNLLDFDYDNMLALFGNNSSDFVNFGIDNDEEVLQEEEEVEYKPSIDEIMQAPIVNILPEERSFSVKVEHEQEEEEDLVLEDQQFNIPADELEYPPLGITFATLNNIAVEMQKNSPIQKKLCADIERRREYDRLRQKRYRERKKILKSLLERKEEEEREYLAPTPIEEEPISFQTIMEQCQLAEQKQARDRDRKASWRARTRAAVEQMVDQAIARGVEKPEWDGSLSADGRQMADQIFKKKLKIIKNGGVVPPKRCRKKLQVPIENRKKPRDMTSPERKIHDRFRKRVWRAKERIKVEKIVNEAISQGVENPKWEKSLVTRWARQTAEKLFKRRRAQMKNCGKIEENQEVTTLPLETKDTVGLLDMTVEDEAAEKQEMKPDVIESIPIDVWNAIMENVIKCEPETITIE